MQPSHNSNHLFALLMVAGALGLRHGFDADHLAAIDGVTRFNATDRPGLARYTGLLFSAGHGLVVLVVAILVSLTATSWKAPGWLEPFGAWASIAVLTFLGAVNIGALRRTPANASVQGVAFRSGMLSSFLRARGGLQIIGVGALFAVSFDTLTQAALMAVTGTALRGLGAAVALAAAFAGGMIVTDGLNGLWVARLIRRTDRTALRASRVMCVSVACISLGAAALGIGAQLSSDFRGWAEVNETWFSVLIVFIMLASFSFGLATSPRRTTAAS